MSDLGIVFSNIDRFGNSLRRAGRKASDEIAILLEDYAKANHLWQPITGQTDATTETLIRESAGQIEITLSAGTPWAIFLEMAREGKFAWLWPAIEANQANIREILRRHLGDANL
jgi:hypothetical protein